MADKKIIVAYDGSSDSKKALSMATDLSKDIAADVVVVSVYDVPIALADGVSYSEWAADCEKACEARVAEGKKLCEDKGIVVYTEVLQGNPADEIIKYAENEQAYLIISGTRGLGGFARLLVGSVAHKIVTYSKIPVLVVK
ncbi:nucleotide-binding universal stress UspA family protein [Sporomusaceae bacterium BoRhaA]|uniref:universal stress protein n=1 Tax=Pelorhabdus rhamnosifermentans TaxID=2772457 RepID=UPI001C05EFA8|nr:universal stress protein [Pelorhabdus rhamnosifermentans]MBU2700618.1 nucleotide-binding universal stress UspA family protein [Pelorhabdus rhamnosifermentans]